MDLTSSKHRNSHVTSSKHGNGLSTYRDKATHTSDPPRPHSVESRVHLDANFMLAWMVNVECIFTVLGQQLRQGDYYSPQAATLYGNFRCKSNAPIPDH